LKQSYTMELISVHCKPVFFHEYALSRLSAEGYRLACASNSIKETIDVMLSKSNLLDYMEVVLSADDVKQPKPSPEIYIKSMEQLSLLPHECLIVEDNEKGIKAAKESGGHVMEIKDIDEVNITNIKEKIKKIEARPIK